MSKKSDNRIIMTFQVFWDGIVWYCKNLDSLLKYMFFPVFGLILGLAVIFTINYFMIINIPSLIEKNPLFFDNLPLVFTMLIICVAPGFLIFSKALFDYLIAYSSVSSMAYISMGGKMKNKSLDTKTHDDILKKRLWKYVVLWLLFSLFTLVGMFPLFIIPCLILFVFFSLIFQVFMLEESVSPIGAFKRSFYLVKNNFGITACLLTLSLVLTYWIIPSLFVFAVEKINIIPYLAYPIQKYLDILPVNEIFGNILQNLNFSFSATQNFLTSVPGGNEITMPTLSSYIDTSKFAARIVEMIILTSVTAFLLPLRCCWFTFLYKIFDSEKTEELRKADNKKGK